MKILIVSQYFLFSRKIKLGVIKPNNPMKFYSYVPDCKVDQSEKGSDWDGLHFHTEKYRNCFND